MRDHDSLNSIFWPLRITFGLVPFLAGLDKFIGLLANWESYVSPVVGHMLPFSTTTFMMIVGVIEMIVGLAILTSFTRLGAYVAMGWLILIAANLVMAGVFDVAVRDLALAVAAWCLGTAAGLKGLEWLPGLVANPHPLRSHATTNS